MKQSDVRPAVEMLLSLDDLGVIGLMAAGLARNNPDERDLLLRRAYIEARLPRNDETRQERARTAYQAILSVVLESKREGAA